MRSTLALALPLTLLADEINLDITTSASNILDLYLKPYQLADVLSHGCWCAQFDSTSDHSLLGGPEFADELDKICHDWRMARRCNDKFNGGSCHNLKTDWLYYDVKRRMKPGAGCAKKYAKNSGEEEVCMYDTCLIDDTYVSLIKTYLSENKEWETKAGNCQLSAPKNEKKNGRGRGKGGRGNGRGRGRGGSAGASDDDSDDSMVQMPGPSGRSLTAGLSFDEAIFSEEAETVMELDQLYNEEEEEIAKSGAGGGNRGHGNGSGSSISTFTRESGRQITNFAVPSGRGLSFDMSSSVAISSAVSSVTKVQTCTGEAPYLELVTVINYGGPNEEEEVLEGNNSDTNNNNGESPECLASCARLQRLYDTKMENAATTLAITFDPEDCCSIVIANSGVWETAIFGSTDVLSYDVEVLTEQFYGYVGWSTETYIESHSGVGGTWSSVSLIVDYGDIQFAGQIETSASAFNTVGGTAKCSYNEADRTFSWAVNGDEPVTVDNSFYHNMYSVTEPRVALSVMPSAASSPNKIRITDAEFYR